LADEGPKIQGEAPADFIVAADLFLQRAASQGKVGGVSAKDFHAQVKSAGELVGERRSAGENRASGFDAYDAGGGVAGERGSGIEA
jgi:hypothetical protein